MTRIWSMSTALASEYPDLRRKVISLAAEHRATTILIEDAGPGMNLLQDLRAAMPQGMTRPIGIRPEGSKVDRMAAQSAKIEAGHVHLPHSATWLGGFLTELLSFPNGRHDDQVDSVSQFLRWLQNDAYSQVPLVAPIVFSIREISHFKGLDIVGDLSMRAEGSCTPAAVDSAGNYRPVRRKM
jgi:predicted phage terminase large subunit-like protein